MIRLRIMILSLMMMSTLVLAQTDAQIVPTGHWSYDVIGEFINNGYISKDHAVIAKTGITRRQFAEYTKEAYAATLTQLNQYANVLNDTKAAAKKLTTKPDEELKITTALSDIKYTVRMLQMMANEFQDQLKQNDCNLDELKAIDRKLDKASVYLAYYSIEIPIPQNHWAYDALIMIGNHGHIEGRTAANLGHTDHIRMMTARDVASITMNIPTKLDARIDTLEASTKKWAVTGKEHDRRQAQLRSAYQEACSDSIMLQALLLEFKPYLIELGMDFSNHAQHSLDRQSKLNRIKFHLYHNDVAQAMEKNMLPATSSLIPTWMTNYSFKYGRLNSTIVQ